MEERSNGTFVFLPSPKGEPTLVTRKVTIVAPPQMVDGKLQELVITALPLPARAPKPPEGKKIEKVIRMVIEPEIRAKETGTVVTHFEPPLIVTMEFTEADAKAAWDPDVAKPRLSIITFYRDADKVIRWQKLRRKMLTRKPFTTGTLTAAIKTLAPKDPVGFGYPD